MYPSTGRLHYDLDTEGYHRLAVQCDQGLADCYRSLIPKYYNAKRPRYPAHITVVRSYKEIPPNLEPWGKYQGEKIEWFYEPVIRMGTTYFWLNALCNRLEDIRIELGLPVRSEYTRPPEGFRKYFHMTIANMKD